MDHSHHHMHAADGGMDHGGMDHGGMDHGGMGSKCSMQMLWNTQIIDTCIVFPQWHIASNIDFVLSFLVIVALGISYEWLRQIQRRVDIRIARSLRPTGSGGAGVSSSSSFGEPNEEDSLLTGSVKGRKIVNVPLFARVYRAAIYASTIFFSFFLMLVFMTYNAYLILAVVCGAALGHYIFGGQMDPEAVLAGDGGGRGMACH